MCAIDFQRAFDSVEHEALWRVLAEQGIDEAYIDVTDLATAELRSSNGGSMTSLDRWAEATEWVREGDDARWRPDPNDPIEDVCNLCLRLRNATTEILHI